MKAIENKTLLEQLNWRYATKKFDPSMKVSESDWNTLSEVLRLSPSSYGLQPWKFVVVQNQALKEQLKAVSWNQPQVSDCSHLVVLASLKTVSAEYVDHFMKSTAKTREQPLNSLDGYRQMIMGTVGSAGFEPQAHSWAKHQTYIAMANLLMGAAMLGIDACPLEGIDSAAYDQLLALKGTNYATSVAVALGYRHKEDGYQHQKKVRFDKSEVFQYFV